ncbi:MAG TPA: DsbA family protein [Marmoricola sp.]|nr:DsbA family protein [Marmoricola sp.]
MSTGLLERPVRPAPRPTSAPLPLDTTAPVHPGRIVVHGDFDCPWSYLAFRRAAILAGAGVEIDWRAVEREAGRRRPTDGFATVQEEMDHVVASLLPGEQLPYDLAGFMPRTSATVAAYAESYAAGVADSVRAVVFESFWMHGVDIGDAKVLRTLLVDELRCSASASEAVREWGYCVDVTGGPISTAAWQLVGAWSTEWRESGREVTPVVTVPGTAPLHGIDAVDWLGAQIAARGLTPEPPARPSTPPPSSRELPGLGWITEQGGRWLPRRQRVVAAASRAAAG